MTQAEADMLSALERIAEALENIAGEMLANRNK